MISCLSRICTDTHTGRDYSFSNFINIYSFTFSCLILLILISLLKKKVWLKAHIIRAQKLSRGQRTTFNTNNTTTKLRNLSSVGNISLKCFLYLWFFISLYLYSLHWETEDCSVINNLTYSNDSFPHLMLETMRSSANQFSSALPEALTSSGETIDLDNALYDGSWAQPRQSQIKTTSSLSNIVFDGWRPLSSFFWRAYNYRGGPFLVADAYHISAENQEKEDIQLKYKLGLQEHMKYNDKNISEDYNSSPSSLIERNDNYIDLSKSMSFTTTPTTPTETISIEDHEIVERNSSAKKVAAKPDSSCSVSSRSKSVDELLVLGSDGKMWAVSTEGCFRWEFQLKGGLVEVINSESQVLNNNESSSKWQENNTSLVESALRSSPDPFANQGLLYDSERTSPSSYDDDVTRNIKTGSLCLNDDCENNHTPAKSSRSRLLPAFDGSLYYINEKGEVTHLEVSVRDIVAGSPFRTNLFPGLYFLGNRNTKVSVLDITTGENLSPEQCKAVDDTQQCSTLNSAPSRVPMHQLQFGSTDWEVFAISQITHKPLWSLRWTEVRPMAELLQAPNAAAIEKANKLTQQIHIEGQRLYIQEEQRVQTSLMGTRFLQFPSSIIAVYTVTASNAISTIRLVGKASANLLLPPFFENLQQPLTFDHKAVGSVSLKDMQLTDTDDTTQANTRPGSNDSSSMMTHRHHYYHHHHHHHHHHYIYDRNGTARQFQLGDGTVYPLATLPGASIKTSDEARSDSNLAPTYTNGSIATNRSRTWNLLNKPTLPYGMYYTQRMLEDGRQHPLNENGNMNPEKPKKKKKKTSNRSRGTTPTTLMYSFLSAFTSSGYFIYNWLSGRSASTVPSVTVPASGTKNLFAFASFRWTDLLLSVIVPLALGPSLLFIYLNFSRVKSFTRLWLLTPMPDCTRKGLASSPQTGSGPEDKQKDTDDHLDHIGQDDETASESGLLIKTESTVSYDQPPLCGSRPCAIVRSRGSGGSKSSVGFITLPSIAESTNETGYVAEDDKITNSVTNLPDYLFRDLKDNAQILPLSDILPSRTPTAKPNQHHPSWLPRSASADVLVDPKTFFMHAPYINQGFVRYTPTSVQTRRESDEDFSIDGMITLADMGDGSFDAKSLIMTSSPTVLMDPSSKTENQIVEEDLLPKDKAAVAQENPNNANKAIASSSVPVDSPLSKFIDNGRFVRTFKDVTLIGRGGFGAVFQARHSLELGEPMYAIKCVTLRLKANEYVSSRKYFREVSANRDIYSKHVVRYYTWWCEEPDFLPQQDTEMLYDMKNPTENEDESFTKRPGTDPKQKATKTKKRTGSTKKKLEKNISVGDLVTKGEYKTPKKEFNRGRSDTLKENKKTNQESFGLYGEDSEYRSASVSSIERALRKHEFETRELFIQKKRDRRSKSRKNKRRNGPKGTFSSRSMSFNALSHKHSSKTTDDFTGNRHNGQFHYGDYSEDTMDTLDDLRVNPLSDSEGLLGPRTRSRCKQKQFESEKHERRSRKSIGTYEDLYHGSKLRATSVGGRMLLCGRGSVIMSLRQRRCRSCQARFAVVEKTQCGLYNARALVAPACLHTNGETSEDESDNIVFVDDQNSTNPVHPLVFSSQAMSPSEPFSGLSELNTSSRGTGLKDPLMVVEDSNGNAQVGPPSALANALLKANSNRPNYNNATVGSSGVDTPADASKSVEYSIVLLIQMEMCSGLTLREWIDRRADVDADSAPSLYTTKHSSTRPVELHLFKQLIKGIRDIHEKGIVHRDLKPENIFVDPKTNLLKIGDFGLARFIEATTQLHPNKEQGGRGGAVDLPTQTTSIGSLQDRISANTLETSDLHTTPTFPTTNETSDNMQNEIQHKEKKRTEKQIHNKKKRKKSLAEKQTTNAHTGPTQTDSPTPLKVGVHLDSQVSLKGDLIGTPGYTAPEGGALCDEKADIYSAALILLELLCPRFETLMERYDTLLQFRNHHKVPHFIREELPAWYQLMMDMARPKPSERPSAAEVYKRVKEILSAPETPVLFR